MNDRSGSSPARCDGVARARWLGSGLVLGQLSEQSDGPAPRRASHRCGLPASPAFQPCLSGAIQVAGGQLIVLGEAGGTMGGYHHVAHVISQTLIALVN